MKKIVVLGSSPAGIRAVEKIKEYGIECQTLVFTLDGSRPCLAHKLADWIARPADKGAALYKPDDFYASANIQFTDAKISRMNLRKNTVTTEDKEKIEYDLMFVTDTGVDRFPDIKGTNKTGVFSAKRPAAINQLINQVTLSETAVVYSNHLTGLKLALALRQRNLEVIWVVPQVPVLESWLDARAFTNIQSLCEAAGVRMILNEQIAEILGDTDTKAVRLGNKKVFATQIVAYCDLQPELKMFKDSELKYANKIDTGEHFQTSIPNIYAFDSVCHPALAQQQRDYGSYAQFLNTQAETAAAHICGKEALFSVSSADAQFKINASDVSLLGDTGAISGLRCFHKGDDQAFAKVFVRDNVLAGAVLVNHETARPGFVSQISREAGQNPLPEGFLDGFTEVTEAADPQETQEPEAGEDTAPETPSADEEQTCQPDNANLNS